MDWDCRVSGRTCSLTTKSTKRSKADAERELELSLKRLKTDYVDSGRYTQSPRAKTSNRSSLLAAPWKRSSPQKRLGRCRFIGFTGHFDPEIACRDVEGILATGTRC